MNTSPTFSRTTPLRHSWDALLAARPAVTRFLAVGLAAAGVFTPSAQATSDTWDGSTNGLWSLNTNWATDPVLVPGLGETATFNGAGNGNTTIDLGLGVTIGRIFFDSAATAAYTIGSGGAGAQTLTFTNPADTPAGTTANSNVELSATVTTAQTVNANVFIENADNTLRLINLTNITTGPLLTLNGTIQGGTAAAKTVNSTGNVTLNGAVTPGAAASISLAQIAAGTLTLSGSATSTLNTLRATATNAQVVVAGQTVTVAAASAYGTNSLSSKFTINSGSVAFNGGIQSGTSGGQPAGADGMAFIVNGGTFSAASVTLGRSFTFSTTGGASVTTAQNMGLSGFQVNGGTATVTGMVNLAGSNSAANGQVTGTGSLTVGGEMIIGGQGSSGTTRTTLFQVTGGTFTNTDTTGNGLVLGRGNTVAGSGQLLLTGGTTTTEKITFGLSGGAAGSFGNLTLNGASAALYVGAGGIVKAATNTYTETINLSNGTLGAKDHWSSALNMNLTGSGVTIRTADALDAAKNIILSGSLSGTNGFTKTGAGTLTLGGVNTYSGDTTVSAGTLQLADNAGLRFVIGATGSNNRIAGAGLVTLEGDFTFDLTAAGTNLGDAWQIVEVGTLTETFGSTFTVANAGAVESGNVWSFNNLGTQYEFSEASGMLMVVPEPGAFACLLGGFGTLIGLQRNRRRHV